MHQKRVVAVEIEVAKKITQKFLLFEKSIATANYFLEKSQYVLKYQDAIFTSLPSVTVATKQQTLKSIKQLSIKKLATEF